MTIDIRNVQLTIVHLPFRSGSERVPMKRCNAGTKAS